MADFKKSYNPNRNADWNYGGKNWKLSRSKIEMFVECPRCFYLDNKLGTARPRGPAFTINIAIDELFKIEFDEYRQTKKIHPLLKQNKIKAIPFTHKQLNDWRDNFIGITYFDQKTGFTISGAVDDIWEKPDGSLIVVDYKATAKESRIETLADSSWETSYKRQMGVYIWLLRKNNFKVDDVGYFVYANAKTKDQTGFNDNLKFETTLVPCVGETDWIESTILKIKDCLDNNALPQSNEDCEYCRYRESAGKKLQAIHYASQTKKS